MTPEPDSRGLFYKNDLLIYCSYCLICLHGKNSLCMSHFTTNTYDQAWRMTKKPSLHYNHKSSRSFTPHIPPHAEHSVHVPPKTESIHIHSWKNTIPITEAGLLTLSHGGEPRDHLSDKLRLNRTYPRLISVLSKPREWGNGHVCPKRGNTIAYSVQRSCRTLCRDRSSTVRTDVCILWIHFYSS